MSLQSLRMTALPVIPERTFDLAATARALTGRVEGDVRFGLHDRLLYATDASLYQVEPLGVVIPSSIQDAVRAVEFCAERSLPILPRGGGTSLAGQCTNRAVVIDFSPRCRAILGVDEASRTCRVEPGITVDDLNDAMAPRGLFFAPDPATARQANIGGCIGNNAAGARSILFGRTSENLVSVEAAVLAEGGVRRVLLERGSRDPFVRDLALRVARVVHAHTGLVRERFPKTVRRNAGYGLDLILNQMDAAGANADSEAVLGSINLSHLLCGSEGTLAVTLGAELILHPAPAVRGLALVGFDSVDAAVAAVAPILGSEPSAVELLDDLILELARANTEYHRYVEVMPTGGAFKAVLYVEYFAAGPEELSAKFAALTGLVGGNGGRVKICSDDDAAAAWKLRKAGEPLLHGMPGDRKPITFVEDNAVPPENLPRFVREFRAIVERHGTRASFWAHASVGVLHVRPLLNLRDELDRRRLREIAVEAADLARSLGGVMSGEHGDGRVRGPLLERYFGPELMRAFRAIKAIFDPRNLLNPGNIVSPGPVESITEHLRIKPREREVFVPDVETYFDYSDQHGFGGAVEACNGAGVCRKKSGGTMCPSYMATLDERHATRGRGNALRLAITGQFGSGAWNDPDTLETLRLCLSCKACKAECPSNVDLARLKAEYTAQGYRAMGRVPLPARMFGHIRTINRLGSLMPVAANWLSTWRPARWLLSRALGVSPRRSLPLFARALPKGFADEPEPALSPEAPVVALFGDCFTMYNEPGIGLAARRVLGAFGYRVMLADAGCCGRAMISMGLLEDAIRTADKTLDRLGPSIADPRVRAVLFLEPSCLSAVKDDWMSLKLGATPAIRRRLAEKSWLFEEFLDREWRRHPRRMELAPSGPVVLHAHCHQKALWGAESSAALLRRTAGGSVTVLDSGCCGMAGSFGYMAGTHGLSMRIGELALFPAVRAAPDAVIVAPGTSCRHQIKDGTGTRAVHPAELLDRLIRGLGPGVRLSPAGRLVCA
jgi:FAD/FMN-containing dehydrogenase/Fe-S oxidoreductase